jgi:hypothetical protein
MIVYIPHLTKTLLKKYKLHTSPCKTIPVVLVVDNRIKLVEADYPPDEGTSKIFIGTKGIAHQKLQYAL